MNTQVIYQSKSGYSKKYAHWIAEAIQTEPASIDAICESDLKAADAIILVGGLYAGQINGLKTLLKYREPLKNKRVLIVAVGINPGSEMDRKAIWEKNQPKDIGLEWNFFYVRGGFDLERLTLKDKFLMTIFRSILRSRKEKTSDELGMLELYDKTEDFSRKEAIAPIINCLNEKE